ncbi:GDP-mannose 4,6-dehydratase [Aureliella helgolandensis]|uniref:UDP-glucuronate decarboxylase n=1 Tax=Aureliella helgolandensis TaxID=2527968 RepID=A0A518G5U4_9BACT|nr:GDP-mannose 4,6-dehydratase [Aureliella helgolandensis]QDV23939.1 Bifunctional polymyxin resistance protein ArnA [Aureliella helgolandensis]
MRYLVTGGCGFIGSHLTETLLAAGHRVTVLDDLSTGCIENLSAVEREPSLRILVGSVTDEALVHEAIRDCDAVFHLASAVGVKLIMDKPVETIDTIVTGTQVVLKQANRYRKPLLLTSTSEVYGKSTQVPFEEDGDRLSGPTTKHRWAYACAKALDEFLAIAYWKTTRLPVVVVRLFNTVGPRQTGQYGMVIPTFVKQARSGVPIQVHGDGGQTRCFCHVTDVVKGLVGLLACQAAYGEVVNLGATEEISILDLAEKIVSETKSSSEVVRIPYEEVYGEGFEDMRRRVPSIDKARGLIDWVPQASLSQIIHDVASQSH